jgi:uncharacterized phage protein (TIGR01671 family)
MTIPKFRAWFKQGSKMVNVATIDFLEKEVKSHANVMYSFDEIELMQSTGLVDENGKEVFEGDIVRFLIADGFEFVVDEIGLVAYQSGAFRVLNGLDEYLINDNEYLIDDIDEIEVIGNIYENPEPWGIGRYYDF